MGGVRRRPRPPWNVESWNESAGEELQALVPSLILIRNRYEPVRRA